MTDTPTPTRGATGIPPRYYDWLSRAVGIGDAQWQLVAQAAIPPHATVLEIGVGTGNVLLKVTRAAPDTIAIGLDPDRASLATTATKAARCGVDLQLDPGDAGHLPYPDAAVDRVLLSFVFHHIPDDQKVVALQEIRRVLKPGGSLHLLDFDPGGRRPRLPTTPHFHRHHGRSDGHPDRRRDVDPLVLMAQAELLDATRVGAGTSVLGRHVFYRASR